MSRQKHFVEEHERRAFFMLVEDDDERRTYYGQLGKQISLVYLQFSLNIENTFSDTVAQGPLT